MDAIQRLREGASQQQARHHQAAEVGVQRGEQQARAIAIQQALRRTMYVNHYDPATVYGVALRGISPYYFGYPSHIGAGVIAAGLAFGTMGDRALGRRCTGRRLPLGQHQRCQPSQCSSTSTPAAGGTARHRAGSVKYPNQNARQPRFFVMPQSGGRGRPRYAISVATTASAEPGGDQVRVSRESRG
jgi:hypothetical protein